MKLLRTLILIVTVALMSALAPAQNTGGDAKSDAKPDESADRLLENTY